MKDTENIFDTSTTLMEIEEPPAGEADSLPHDKPAPGTDREPDYFTPNPTVAHTSARRRALSVLGLVGGGIFATVLISAATGSGNDRATSTYPVRTHSSDPVPGRTATIVGPEPTPRVHAHPGTAAHGAHGASRPGRSARSGSGGSARMSGTGAPAHRKHHSPKPPAGASAPPPEPTYSPEPETTYVPTESAPPPPPTTPSSSAPSPSRAAQREFGIEP